LIFIVDKKREVVITKAYGVLDGSEGVGRDRRGKGYAEEMERARGGQNEK